VVPTDISSLGQGEPERLAGQVDHGGQDGVAFARVVSEKRQDGFDLGPRMVHDLFEKVAETLIDQQDDVREILFAEDTATVRVHNQPQ
jgi:hypothetical protein